jgi:sterol desaturase/sphingolipid hydroxylase (fatty acid hydroxylase superfamily)
VIAGLAAWLSYRGWTALAGTGVARSFDAGRYQLAGPVVLGFVPTGSGFSDLLARLAPWLVLPLVPGVPGWCFVGLAVIAIDAVDWLTHLANHRLTALWRLHAVHHSQEELSILTTYRAHPLVHVSFLVSAVPVLAVADNTATPAVVMLLLTAALLWRRR